MLYSPVVDALHESGPATDCVLLVDVTPALKQHLTDVKSTRHRSKHQWGGAIFW